MNESAILQALRRKVRAARAIDDRHYYDERFVGTYDLEKKSGKWPDSRIDLDPDEYIFVNQRHRLVLCSPTEPIGFCTFGIDIDFFTESKVPTAEIEIRGVFLDPEHRGQRLSDLFASAVASIALRMLQEFQMRLVASGTTRKFELALSVKGEIISAAGERFLINVAEQAWIRSRRVPPTTLDGRAVFYITEVNAFDDD